MKKKTKGGKSNRQKAELGLPDLDHAKSAVLVSLRLDSRDHIGGAGGMDVATADERDELVAKRGAESR